ncbi:hypothetical protein ACUNWD_14090 [Sunxiuqinia sp. A32]|uniref:hypothetical protein n=1 Tax=Sunxiuqinia sp. A32 TaxID=3461496 RepID=UPI004045529D
MSNSNRPIKYLFAEIIIILIFFFVGTNFVDKTITGDGVGYYEYLPSIFIYHDFVRIHNTDEENQKFNDRTSHYGFYGEQAGHYVNRYACGTALLQSPFFLYAWLSTDMQGDYEDGYQKRFHRSIYFAAVFYLFLSLVFLRRLLLLFDIKWFAILLSQVLLLFGTSVTQYGVSNAAFSHVYSLFAIAAFLYFSKVYFKSNSRKAFLLACLFLGLIILLRQINGMIIFFLPFISGSWSNFKESFIRIFKDSKLLKKSITLCTSVVSIQLLAWYLQTGKLVLYSYQGYGFNWFHPEMINILFSYRKGLFIYTPILLVSAIGLSFLINRKRYFEAFSWTGYFLLLTYVLSSWCYWYYGGSYGLRAYIEYYPIFFILLSVLIDWAKYYMKVIFVLIALLTIPLNLVQTYQYRQYILHASEMNKKNYWKIFLKTDERYKGIFYQKPFSENDFYCIGFEKPRETQLNAYKQKVFWEMEGDEFVKYGKVDVIQLRFTNQFFENDSSRIAISVDDKLGKNKLFHRPHIIQFARDYFGREQQGLYNYWIPGIEDIENCKLRLILVAGSEGAEMKNTQVRFYRHKR